MTDAANEDYLDIDHVSEAVSKVTNVTRGILTLDPNKPDGPQPALNRIIMEDRGNTREVSVLDLSDQPDDLGIQVQLEVAGRQDGEVPILDLSNIHDGEDMDLQVSRLRFGCG